MRKQKQKTTAATENQAAKNDKQSKPPIFFRGMVRRDLLDVAYIEFDLFHPLHLTPNDLAAALREKNVWGWVVEVSGKIAGYIIWRMESGGLRILRMAVAWEYQNRGIGREIIEAHAFKRLSLARRPFCVAEVRESRLDAQLFLKAVGFRAVGVVRNRYNHRGDTGESAIVFEYAVPGLYRPGGERGADPGFFVLNGSETIQRMGGCQRCRKSQ